MQLGFFSGVEFEYVLSIDGQITIDLFGKNVSQYKQNFRQMLQTYIDRYKSYATSSLPEYSETRRIVDFGKP